MINFDFARLRRIGFNPSLASRLGPLDSLPENAVFGRISGVFRDAVALHDGEAETVMTVLPSLLHALQADGQALTVGDWAAAVPQADGSLWLSDWLPPEGVIARRANDGRRQVLASNVDTALLVMGLDLDFNLRRLERTIAMVQAAGIAPLVVLSKADCATGVEEKCTALAQRLPPAIPWLALNTLDSTSADALAPWLGAGQTVVLLGSSGTGKSTLTNTLAGAGQATGAARLSDGRGRHTTTGRSLHLCPGGACIIDTPGLRTWRPDADADALAATFEDIEALAAHCQYRDCRHGSEPGCAVRATVDADRLMNYHKLLRDAARGTQTPLDRIAERARWKAIGRAGAARARDKRS